jgi:hypothetical protein
VSDTAPTNNEIDYAGGLVSWIENYLKPWRTFRDTTHKTDWDLFYRMWRSMWAVEDKNRKSERSQLVSPGTMQAVDSTVSEIEEAIFGQEQWFEVDEDLTEIADPAQRDEMIAARDRLREKFNDYGVETAAAKCFLIGAIYGTGIGKINTTVDDYRYIEIDPQTSTPIARTRKQVCVELIPLEPYEFIPDPTTDCIDEMLGAAHETLVPLHKIRMGIKSGKYRKVEVSGWSGTENDFGQMTGLTAITSKNAGLITEWHGLVPSKYLIGLDPTSSPEEIEMLAETADDENLVEAIVTILNRSTVLEAKPTPFFMKDRSFIAYQNDTIPGYFWGRGVPEKALNSQKAKDAELRSRIDALAFVSAPMLAGDVTRLPRGFNLGVHPGKFWPTTGNPGESITAFRFGDLNASTFQQSAELDSMLQGATGAMDPITAFGSGQGPTDRGMASSALIKRSKRALKNIERNFLQPLVRKALWRYIQFDPKNFPQDYQFRVKGALGVMAREIEQQQNIQLLSVVPNESPPFMVLLKSIFANGSSPMKGEMVAAVDKLLQPLDPQAQQEQEAMKQLGFRKAMAETMKLEAEAGKSQADANLSAAKAGALAEETQMEHEKIQSEMIGHAIDLKEANSFQAQTEVSRIMTQLRAAEIALKAIQTQVSVQKVQLEAKKIAKQGST